MHPKVQITDTKFWSHTEYFYDGIWVGATVYVQDIWRLSPYFGELADDSFLRWCSKDSWSYLEKVFLESDLKKEPVIAVCIGLGDLNTDGGVIFCGSVGDMRFIFATSLESLLISASNGVAEIVKVWELP